MDRNNSRDISPLDSTRWIWITRRARIAGHGPIVRAVFHVLRARRCASMQKRWEISFWWPKTPPKTPQKAANSGREIPDGTTKFSGKSEGWWNIYYNLARIMSAMSTSRIRTRSDQDQDLYHSERAFRGFLLGPTIGVTLGSWDKAHLSNKIKVAWFYPMSTRTKVISFGSLQLAFKRYIYIYLTHQKKWVVIITQLQWSQTLKAQFTAHFFS